MKVKLYNLWQKLRSSYWFIPSLMAVLAMILATTLTDVDARFSPDWLEDLSFIYLNQPPG